MLKTWINKNKLLPTLIWMKNSIIFKLIKFNEYESLNNFTHSINKLKNFTVNLTLY